MKENQGYSIHNEWVNQLTFCRMNCAGFLCSFLVKRYLKQSTILYTLMTATLCDCDSLWLWHSVTVTGAVLLTSKYPNNGDMSGKLPPSRTEVTQRRRRADLKSMSSRKDNNITVSTNNHQVYQTGSGELTSSPDSECWVKCSGLAGNRRAETGSCQSSACCISLSRTWLLCYPDIGRLI